MVVRVAGLLNSLHNGNDYSDGYTILGSAISTLPMSHHEIDIKIRVENAEHCQQGCQKENRVSLSQ